MSWRNRWGRATRAAGLLILLAIGGAGCHLLPVGRVNPALDPRSLGRREGASQGEAGAVAMKSPTKSADAASTPATATAAVSKAPAVATAMSVPLPKLPLQPMTDREVLAVVAPPAETPLLDEALQRAQGRQDATLFVGRDGSELVEAAVREVREASGPVRGSGFDPVALEEVPAAQAGPRPDLILLPPPTATGVIEPLLGVATRLEENEPAASSPLPASVADTNLLTLGNAPPEATARVIEAPKAMREPSQDQEWFTELRRLHAAATQHAASSSEPQSRSMWEMRAGLLAWLCGEAPQAAIGTAPAITDESQHPLWSVAFALLSEGAHQGETNEREGDESGELKTDLDLRAAAWAIESRMPLTVSTLELCQKVRSFGNYDVVDTSQVRAWPNLDPLLRDGRHQLRAGHGPGGIPVEAEFNARSTEGGFRASRLVARSGLGGRPVPEASARLLRELPGRPAWGRHSPAG